MSSKQKEPKKVEEEVEEEGTRSKSSKKKDETGEKKKTKKTGVEEETGKTEEKKSKKKGADGEEKEKEKGEKKSKKGEEDPSAAEGTSKKKKDKDQAGEQPAEEGKKKKKKDAEVAEPAEDAKKDKKKKKDAAEPEAVVEDDKKKKSKKDKPEEEKVEEPAKKDKKDKKEAEPAKVEEVDTKKGKKGAKEASVEPAKKKEEVAAPADTGKGAKGKKEEPPKVEEKGAKKGKEEPVHAAKDAHKDNGATKGAESKTRDAKSPEPATKGSSEKDKQLNMLLKKNEAAAADVNKSPPRDTTAAKKERGKSQAAVPEAPKRSGPTLAEKMGMLEDSDKKSPQSRPRAETTKATDKKAVFPDATKSASKPTGKAGAQDKAQEQLTREKSPVANKKGAQPVPVPEKEDPKKAQGTDKSRLGKSFASPQRDARPTTALQGSASSNKLGGRKERSHSAEKTTKGNVNDQQLTAEEMQYLNMEPTADTDFETRNKIWLARKKAKTILGGREANQEEVKDCTFQPHLNIKEHKSKANPEEFYKKNLEWQNHRKQLTAQKQEKIAQDQKNTFDKELEKSKKSRVKSLLTSPANTDKKNLSTASILVDHGRLGRADVSGNRPGMDSFLKYSKENTQDLTHDIQNSMSLFSGVGNSTILQKAKSSERLPASENKPALRKKKSYEEQKGTNKSYLYKSNRTTVARVQKHVEDEEHDEDDDDRLATLKTFLNVSKKDKSAGAQTSTAKDKKKSTPVKLDPTQVFVSESKNPTELLKKGYKTLEIRNNRYVIVENPIENQLSPIEKTNGEVFSVDSDKLKKKAKGVVKPAVTPFDDDEKGENGIESLESSGKKDNSDDDTEI